MAGGGGGGGFRSDGDGNVDDDDNSNGNVNGSSGGGDGGSGGGGGAFEKAPPNPLVSETVHDKKSFIIFSPLPVGTEPLFDSGLLPLWHHRVSI